MNGKDDPSAVVYQDGDSVSFTASMKESFGKVGGCEIEEETTTMEWLAIHFVGTKGESECAISENIELCHHDEEQEQAVDMHTATCDKNRFTVVQIFFKDDGLVQGHTIAEVNHDGDNEEETVDVPSSCFSFGGLFSSMASVVVHTQHIFRFSGWLDQQNTVEVTPIHKNHKQVT